MMCQWGTSSLHSVPATLLAHNEERQGSNEYEDSSCVIRKVAKTQCIVVGRLTINDVSIEEPKIPPRGTGCFMAEKETNEGDKLTRWRAEGMESLNKTMEDNSFKNNELQKVKRTSAHNEEEWSKNEEKGEREKGRKGG